MKLLTKLLMLAALVSPAYSQVEMVAIKTSGISCGTCAAVSEFYLRRMPTIDKINISMKNEAVMVSYKAGSTFEPRDLREVFKKTDVTVTQFQISAQGRVQEQAGKRFFIAGKNRFILAADPKTAQLPLDSPLTIEAIVNDKVSPMELRIMTFRTAK
jgi:hypothetical protein